MRNTVTTVHIFLEIDRSTRKKLEFDSSQVTGRQIKEKGGVPLNDDLARKEGNKLDLVTNDQFVHIKDGDQFIALPPGTIS